MKIKKEHAGLEACLKLLKEALELAKKQEDNNGEFGKIEALGNLKGTIKGILGHYTEE